MDRIPPACPIPGRKFQSFASWHGVLHAAEHKVSLFYWAPLDTAPRPVFVTRTLKNRKLRICGGEVTFTADQAHLDRFYWLAGLDGGQ